MDDSTTHSDETVTNNDRPSRGSQITPSRSSSSPSRSPVGTVRLIRSTTSPRRRRTLEAKTPRTSSSVVNRIVIERGVSRRTASLGAAGKKLKKRKPTQQPVPPSSPSITSNLVEEQVSKSVRHLKEIVYLGSGTLTGYNYGSERFLANRKANKESNSGGLKTMIAQMNAKLIGLVDGFFGRGLVDNRSSSRVKLTTTTKTRIPIKKDSTLRRKLIEEILTQQQQQHKQQNLKLGQSCMIERIRSMFPRSPSPPSQLSYLKPDLVHDNYSRIFESMRQVDEKNLDGLLLSSAAKPRVFNSLRRHQIERHLKNDNLLKVIIFNFNILILFNF